MGEHKNGNIIDLSVSDRAIRAAKREFCRHLSERLLHSMCGCDTVTEPKVLLERAWSLAELHYDEFIRREALIDESVTLTERMAADRMQAGIRAA